MIRISNLVDKLSRYMSCGRSNPAKDGTAYGLAFNKRGLEGIQMSVGLTKEQLSASVGSSNPDKVSSWVTPVGNAMAKFGIDSPKRKAAFLAQVGHESAALSRLEENLNYSAEGLLKIFKKYFPDQVTANNYARQPQKIANKVYASRMGNGDEASGEGWKYRGRGVIQLTGKNNYSLCSKALSSDFINTPDLLLTPEWAAMSAAWFWSDRKLNIYADKDDFVGLTKAINGGTHGLEDRRRLWENAKAAFGVV